MNAQTEVLLQAGPAGELEVALDRPTVEPRGCALIAHPHPLHGGTMTNKVVQTVARACVQQGWLAVRWNFRGVGRSSGVYDEGRGELDDLLAVVQTQAPSGPLCLAGFSFGAFVTTHAVARLTPQRDVQRIATRRVVTVAGMGRTRQFTEAPRRTVMCEHPLTVDVFDGHQRSLRQR
jgi:alpha/beta superfamily hydrolase